MLRRKKTKVASLFLTFVMLVLLFLHVPPCEVGVYVGCPAINRFTYSLFHANIIHLFLNVWCFLSCVFLADVPASVLAASFLIASTVPAYSCKPTVGLSGVCFALLGFIMLNARKKTSYNIYIAISILLPTVLLPGSINNLAHAYCYAAAAISGWLFTLIRKHGKGS